MYYLQVPCLRLNEDYRWGRFSPAAGYPQGAAFISSVGRFPVNPPASEQEEALDGTVGTLYQISMDYAYHLNSTYTAGCAS